jgi:hypothetical protein
MIDDVDCKKEWVFDRIFPGFFRLDLAEIQRRWPVLQPKRYR